MDGIHFIEKIEAAGFTLAATGENLAVTPASKLSDQQRAFIRQHKPELLRLLAGKAATAAADLDALAQSIASEHRIMPEQALSILDDEDREAIRAGSDPGRVAAWREAVRSLIVRGVWPNRDAAHVSNVNAWEIYATPPLVTCSSCKHAIPAGAPPHPA